MAGQAWSEGNKPYITMLTNMRASAALGLHPELSDYKDKDMHVNKRYDGVRTYLSQVPGWHDMSDEGRGAMVEIVAMAWAADPNGKTFEEPAFPAPPLIDPTRSDDMQYVQKINHEIADYLFPDRTDGTMYLKLYSEIGEMVDNPGSDDEIADVFIMLLDHAERHHIHVGAAVLAKLYKNLRRKWVIDPNTGVANHVKEP